MFTTRRYTLLALASLSLLLPLQKATAAFITADFRGQTNTNYGVWDVFTDVYTPPTDLAVSGEGNLADYASSGSFSGKLFQTGSSTAFPTSGGNIYSFSAATGFVVTDSNSYAAKTVLLNIRTLGTLPDYNSFFLVADFGSGLQSIAPTFTAALFDEANPAGGSTADWAAQWDLSTYGGALSYQIVFNASGSSMSLDMLSLETSGGPSSSLLPVPEPHSGLLALASLGGLVMLRRRKRA
jgi:MYXO-CTERM domain-containing protein